MATTPVTVQLRAITQTLRKEAQAALPAIGLLVLFAFMWRWAQQVLYLPQAGYRSSVVSLSILRQMVSTPTGIVGAAPLLLLLIVRRKEFAVTWEDLDLPSGVRAFVLALVVWAVWVCVTFDHNLFFDQSYNVDRALLVMFVVLVFWRPAFVLPIVFIFIALEHQFDHPLGRQIFSRRILEMTLLLFGASILVHAITRRRGGRSFVFAALIILCSYYWFPGYVKLDRGWFWYGQLYLGGFASYVNGWLAMFSLEQVEGLLRIGAVFDWPGRTITLLSELGALAFFVHRHASRALLAAWTALHIGIWLFSGVSFLIWIVVDVGFLWLLLQRTQAFGFLFTPAKAVVGASLMLLSPLWLRPPAVGWFDTNLIYTFRYEAVDSEGNRGAFSADATPLRQAWCGRDFPYLVTDLQPLLLAGKTNSRALADQVRTSGRSDEDIREFEARHGTVLYNEQRALNFDRFIGATVKHWNRRGSERHALSWAAPPRTCLSPRKEPEAIIDTRYPIRQIVVNRVTFSVDNGALREVRRAPVRTIDIPE